MRRYVFQFIPLHSSIEEGFCHLMQKIGLGELESLSKWGCECGSDAAKVFSSTRRTFLAGACLAPPDTLNVGGVLEPELVNLAPSASCFMLHAGGPVEKLPTPAVPTGSLKQCVGRFPTIVRQLSWSYVDAVIAVNVPPTAMK
eukprot:2272979-Amphidinium_carterae.1